VAGLGIDAEPDTPLPAGVLGCLADAGEQAALAALGAAGGPSWGRLLFCAKEAVYKLWFPLMGSFLGFADAHVDLRSDGRFEARLRRPLAVRGLTLTALPGRWAADGGLLLAAVAVAAPV
jgi:4'-phosphopantetheinyl transferase EntD